MIKKTENIKKNNINKTNKIHLIIGKVKEMSMIKSRIKTNRRRNSNMILKMLISHLMKMSRICIKKIRKVILKRIKSLHSLHKGR